ncbi:hypothetical protein [Bacillus sp. AG4(2022)]|uniref:hypothetical protein n=1 Tax=Bacillus sp. AG4(2022) TaxID=2962594 RepID=UPI0028828F05|nr:hypothetical protein [Bacillus sp. AG4(2022)]MDT0160327.1 hypothetical protein [Bacillus sp. AG4(2022)]
MYEVFYVINDNECIERFEEEPEAMERYQSLIDSQECKYVEITKLINNWSDGNDKIEVKSKNFTIEYSGEAVGENNRIINNYNIIAAINGRINKIEVNEDQMSELYKLIENAKESL